MFFSKKPTAIGLDLGDHSLKIIALRTEKIHRKKGALYTIQLHADIPIPPGTVVQGVIREKEKLLPVMEEAEKQTRKMRNAETEILFSVPETQSFLTQLTLPSHLDAETRKKHIDEHCAESFPWPPEQLYRDITVLKKTKDEEHLLLGAAPIQAIDPLLHLTETAGIPIHVIDFESIATIRAVAYITKQTSSWGLLDLGGTRAQAFIVQEDIPIATLRLPLAGEMLTGKIEKALQYTKEKAEETKKTCGLSKDACTGALKAILPPAFSLAAERLEEMFRIIPEGTTPVEKLFLVGGGAHCPDLVPFLKEKLHIDVAIPELFTSPSFHSPSPILPPFLGFATALGLALRGVQGENDV